MALCACAISSSIWDLESTIVQSPLKNFNIRFYFCTEERRVRTQGNQAEAATAAQGSCPPGLPDIVAQLPRSFYAATAYKLEQLPHQPLLILHVALRPPPLLPAISKERQYGIRT